MDDSRWEDARRLEAWAGEIRVNLIRCLALVLFYANHLLNVYVFKEDPSAGGRFHVAATAVVLTWAIGILVLHVCLTRRWMPASLMYLSTALDLLLLTALLLYSPEEPASRDVPEGPRSPLMLVYFVIVAASPLRLSLSLVVTTTFAALLCALIVLGKYVIFRVGWEAYYASKDLRIPRVTEILLLALAAVGVLAGQMVRQARRLVQGYPVRVQSEKEAA